jgi:succinate--hydroxymethylglutarate CoA-transferase
MFVFVGRKIIKDLAVTSDVFVENYLLGKLDSWGLGYADMAKIAPQLIYCSISGFGTDGPYKDRAGCDVIAASLGGLMHITGPEVIRTNN